MAGDAFFFGWDNPTKYVTSYESSRRFTTQFQETVDVSAQEVPTKIIKGEITLPETNIAPENRPSQKETSIPTIHFQGLC